ncbi:MAG TPA: NUDIX domain-containing protein [Candidatus Saccharimonadales bacterium]|nr:NUDIX domain-containing protein [Candidatus Saccharimonadales bacterium]
MTNEERAKQEYYRDARTGGYYGDIWTSVGKCVFCDLREKYIFYEENGMVMTVALYAYIDGNLMIIPRRHIKSVKELTALEWETARKMMYIAKKLIRKVHGIKGLQYVIRDGGIEAQSTVSDHLHIHCIPFDAPDLSTWNYRKLKYTPLENANLYKSQAKKVTELSQKFVQKYDQKTQLEVNCNLILINDRSEVLFHERPSWAQIGDNWISPPGGMVRSLDRSLEEELAREVHEETGLKLSPKRFELVESSIEKLTRHRQNPDSGQTTPYIHRFLWNIYVLKGVGATVALKPGDDAVKLLWIPLSDIQNHPRISAGVKAAIAKATA